MGVAGKQDVKSFVLDSSYSNIFITVPCKLTRITRFFNAFESWLNNYTYAKTNKDNN